MMYVEFVLCGSSLLVFIVGNEIILFSFVAIY